MQTAFQKTSFHTGLVWLRRDLRVHDNAALNAALRCCAQVHCVFIFDRQILEGLPHADRRVEFIHSSLLELDDTLRKLSGHHTGGLIVLHDWASEALPKLALDLHAQAVFCAQDYEPVAQDRDAKVAQSLQRHGIALTKVKDHVIFEKDEILTQAAKPYTVFTPYKRAWLARLAQQLEQSVQAFPASSNTHASSFSSLAPRPAAYAAPIISLQDLGFVRTNLQELHIPTGMSGAQKLLDDFWERMDAYDQTRDYPAVKGPSYLGVHLRFGTLSIRHLASLAWQRQVCGSTGAATWLSELAWRDFYFQILANFPHVAHSSFKPEYDQIVWETGSDAQTLFDLWCQGKTGYPLVDAAMAQLAQTGYMHNRLRMVAGSFLVKHLGLDWRWGERYFAEKLNDFDLAANNGGWQWVSSCGCDAQPYFRIFNPVTQSQKFDAQAKFIRRYVPQLAALDATSIHAPWLAKPGVLSAAGIVLGQHYPAPIVDHVQARNKTLQRYAVVRKVSQASKASTQ